MRHARTALLRCRRGASSDAPPSSSKYDTFTSPNEKAKQTPTPGLADAAMYVAAPTDVLSAVPPKENALQRDAAEERKRYLAERWKSDDRWHLPGVDVAITEEQQRAMDSQGLLHRPFGIYDEPPIVAGKFQESSDQGGSFIKDKRIPPNLLYKPPPEVPTQVNDSLYADTDTPSHLENADDAPLAWEIQVMYDTPSYERALGEQLFRTQDLDRLSTELHPVGHGLAVNTCALVTEDESTARRFYAIVGGRSSHKAFVTGNCVTMRADAELFMHVVHYFGENWGQSKVKEQYHHKYRGMCQWGQGYDEEDEEFMNGFFEAAGLSLKCDPDRLDEACEGYVPVLHRYGGQVPSQELWSTTSTGVFIWQNFLMSVPDEVQQQKFSHVRRWWCDPYTQRVPMRVRGRAVTGHANHTGDPDFHLKWGEHGERGMEIKQRAGLEKRLGTEKPIKIGSAYTDHGYTVTNPQHGQGVHPIFTTKPKLR